MNTLIRAGAVTWLGGLRTMALCDGIFGVEEARLLDDELVRLLPGESLDPWPESGEEALVRHFGRGTAAAEDFLRTALAVALADGFLSPEEVALMRSWGAALEGGEEVLLHLQDDHQEPPASADALAPLRQWLNDLTCDEPSVARFLVRLIPAQCPFARDVTIFGRTILHIPPLCKLNPLYEELMALRFRAMCFLEAVGRGSDRS